MLREPPHDAARFRATPGDDALLPPRSIIVTAACSRGAAARNDVVKGHVDRHGGPYELGKR